MKINVMDWVNETTPANQFRALDGSVFPFPFQEAELLAASSHDAVFKLTSNYGWGVRWYALHRVSDKFVFTVGHGYWLARREVPAELVPDLLRRFFTHSGLTDAGKALLK